MTRLDLPRTKAALARYDRLEPRLERLLAFTRDEHVEDVLASAIDRLGEAVGIAYGLDTAAFNNPETCRKCIRPGPRIPGPGQELSFVRRMVALSCLNSPLLRPA